MDLLACCQWIDDWTVLPHEREEAHADQGQATSSGSLGEKGGSTTTRNRRRAFVPRQPKSRRAQQLSSAQLSTAQRRSGRAVNKTKFEAGDGSRRASEAELRMLCNRAYRWLPCITR